MSAGELKFLVDVGVGKKVEDNMKNNFCVYQNEKFRFRKLSRAK
jgi:hypothetical protein